MFKSIVNYCYPGKVSIILPPPFRVLPRFARKAIFIFPRGVPA